MPVELPTPKVIESPRGSNRMVRPVVLVGLGVDEVEVVVVPPVVDVVVVVVVVVAVPGMHCE